MIKEHQPYQIIHIRDTIPFIIPISISYEGTAILEKSERFPSPLLIQTEYAEHLSKDTAILYNNRFHRIIFRL